MVATHLEKIFYHYLLSRKELISVVNTRFFETEDIKKVYELTKEFVEKYSAAPSKSQIVELTKVKGLHEDLTSSKLESIFDVRLADYDSEWLKETSEAWIEYKNLDISVLDLINYLKTTKVNTDNVRDVVQNAKNLITERNNIQFDFDEGLDFFNPESHLQPTSDTFSSGISYVDLVLGGGFYSKALFCFMGEMKIGKCHTFDTFITVRNKKTGKIEKIKVGDFHNRCLKEGSMPKDDIV